MSMKINVMYRGIVYRVRGMKVLCSVITAVIVLLIAIVALGIWMLVSAYAGEKFDASSNTTSIAGLTMNLELNSTNDTTSTVPGVDFNAPSSTLQDTSLPINDPSSLEERDLVNEAVGHLAGATPGKADTDPSREAGPDPAFGLFSGLLDLGLSNNEPNVNLPVSPAPIPGTWRPLEDSVVELSDSRPVIVQPPPRRQFDLRNSSPPDTLNRRVDSGVFSESSSNQAFNPSIVDKSNAGYAPTGHFGTSFTNPFPYGSESYETNYENTFPSRPSSFASDFIGTGPTEDSKIYSTVYGPTDTSSIEYDNVRRSDSSFQQSANQQPDTLEPSIGVNRPLLTIGRDEFSNQYSDISLNPTRPDYSVKGQVENVDPIIPYNIQSDSFEYTDRRQTDRNINTGTEYDNRYSDTVNSESSVVYDERRRPENTNNANQFQQYDENLDYYDSEYDQTNRQSEHYDQINRRYDDYDQTNRQSDNYDPTNRRSDNYDQTNRRSDNYETEFIDARIPVRQSSNDRPSFPSISGIPPGLIPQNMDPALLGIGLPLPGMIGLGGLMNQRVHSGQQIRYRQNVKQYPNRQLYNPQQQSFLERQGIVVDNVDEDTNKEQGYQIQDSDLEHYNNNPYLPGEVINGPHEQKFNSYDYIKDSSPHEYSGDVHPDIPQEFLQNGKLPDGFTIPPGFKIPSNVPENLPSIPGLNRGNTGPYLGGPGSHMQDMLYYYNKHEKQRPTTTESTQVITDKNNYNNRAGPLEDQTHQNYSGPAVVGYGNKPFRLIPNHERKEIFSHFKNVYDATGSTPGIHEDRGSGPVSPKPYDIHGRSPNGGPGKTVLTTEGHASQFDKNIRRVDSNPNFNKNYHSTNLHSQITTIVPRPNLRGPRPNGGGYGNLATRPDAQGPAQINPDTEDPILDENESNSNKPQILISQQRPTGQPESNLQLRPGTYERPDNIQRQPYQQRPNNQQRPINQKIPINQQIPYNQQRPNNPHRQNNQARFDNMQNQQQRHNFMPGMPNRQSGSQRIGNQPIQNPDRKLWAGPSNPQQELLVEDIPENHRPFLGPLHDIFEYSKKLAASLLSPFNPPDIFKDSTAEYMKNTVELLEDYNKVFKSGDVSSADVLPDMFDGRPDRNERLMLLDTDELEALGPIEMTLITWTFLDFWEFMIEKVGTLSKDDLQILESRLERLRRQKDKTLTNTIINATIASMPHNLQMANISQTLALSEREDPDYETEGPEARMWDPLGLFDSQQKVQFMEFAIQVLFKFGRVYLRKQYALDCMMLLFCKDLNSKTRKDGLDGLAAKIKSVGLKVLTVREERDGEMDTIGEIWKALTAWDTLQCDAMFPKCDGTKALEIVNEVALGD